MIPVRFLPSLLGLGLVFISLGCRAADPAALGHPVRVACVGDSITQGVGTSQPVVGSYPAQLQSLLGPQWEVHNFGVSGRTMLRKADAFDHRPALESAPDIVVIALGTNDSKTGIWEVHKDEFVDDYVAMVKEFQALPSHPRVLACLPVPAFPGNWGVTEASIRDGVIPAIKKAAKLASIQVIDLHAPMLEYNNLFPDTVHPNEAGAKRIAELVAAGLTKR